MKLSESALLRGDFVLTLFCMVQVPGILNFYLNHKGKIIAFPDFHISFEAQRLNAGLAGQSNKSENRLEIIPDESKSSNLCIPAEFVSNSKTFYVHALYQPCN